MYRRTNEINNNNLIDFRKIIKRSLLRNRSLDIRFLRIKYNKKKIRRFTILLLMNIKNNNINYKN